MRLAATIVCLFAGVMACGGCREQPQQGPLDRNLGDKPGELMPVAVAPADKRILDDQSSVTEQTFGQGRRSELTPGGTNEGEAGRRGRSGGVTPPAAGPRKAGADAAGAAGLAALMDKSDKTKKALTAKTEGPEAPKMAPAKAPKAAAVPVAEPTEKPAGKPVEKAAEKVVEKPAEKPADKPAVKLAEKAAEKAAGKPVEKAAEKVTEKPAEKPADKLAAKVAEKPAAAPVEAKPTPSPANAAGKAPTAAATPSPAPAGRVPDSLSLTLEAPWQAWTPTTGGKPLAAYTQKGVADVAAWGFALPREITPELAGSEIGRFALAAKLKDEGKRRFQSVDKWAPGSQATTIDGVQVVEVTCTLGKGEMAGVQDTGTAVCLGVVGKTKGFLVAYRVPASNKNADAVRKAILGALKLK
jgi:hypothetical protein